MGRTFEIVHCRWPNVRGLGSLWYGGEVRRAVRQRGLPDAFYGRHLVSLSRLRRCRRPLIAEVHTPPPHVFQRQVEALLLRSRELETLVVISAALKAEYRRLFPSLGAERIVVAHNGANADVQGGVERSLGGRPGAPRVGYVGHLYAGKGVELIRTQAAEMPHVDFHIFGGIGHDLARWQLAARYPNLVFHAHLPPHEVASTVRAFKIALAPYNGRVCVSGGRGDVSRWMSPLKVFEYMAHARAIVATDLPVIREIIEDGRSGLLCGEDDPAAWRCAIQRLIDHPQLVDDLGARARATLLERYTWEQRARTVLQALDPRGVPRLDAGVEPAMIAP